MAEQVGHDYCYIPEDKRKWEPIPHLISHTFTETLEAAKGMIDTYLQWEKHQLKPYDYEFIDYPEKKEVSIDFGKSENLTISDEGFDLRLTIRALGTFSIPKKIFFDGVEKIKML